ncbi:MAG: signal peptidase I [Treponema sp.]|nr:signal peptidase I [Treponema sp.]
MYQTQLSPSAKSIIKVISIGLIAGLFLKLFVIDFLHVSGTSMEGAIKDGSVIAVNRLAYGIAVPYSNRLLIQWNRPKEGDIVIYMYNNKIVVKRCAAVSEQSLEYSANSLYNLKIGDKNIPLTKEQYFNLKDCSKVPEGYILAIGDNYEKSVDSRDYGFVSVRNVLGKVICR